MGAGGGTLSCVSFPQGALRAWRGLVRSSVGPCPPLEGGDFCFVFGVLFSFSSVCLGRRPFLWLSAKRNVLELPVGEETWAGQCPDERCSVLPVPRHSVKEPRGAASPGLCCPTPGVTVYPAPPLASAALTSAWPPHPPGPPEPAVGGGACRGRRGWGKRPPWSGLQSPPQAPGGEKPPRFTPGSPP